MSAKIFVGNLSPDITGDELCTLFSEVGEVKACRLIIDRNTGQSRGFGFIEMTSMEAAGLAKEKFNGQEVRGRALKVNNARPSRQQRNPGDDSASGQV